MQVSPSRVTEESFRVHNNFLDNISFSDKYAFCLNNDVQRNNCRYWTDRNSNWIEHDAQRPQKVNVWYGHYFSHTKI